MPEIFKIISQMVEPSEMQRIFNNGVGLVLVLPKENVDFVLNNSDGYIIGEVIQDSGVEMV